MKMARLGLRLVLSALIAGVLLAPAVVKSQDTSSPTKRKVSHRVVPEYPTLARQMNITGKVKLEATVEPDGNVKNIHALGGSPLLVQAATQALKNWKFEPGPKETTEVIEFDFKDE